MGIYIKGMDFLPEDGTEFIVKKDEYGTWIKPIGHMGFSMRLIEIPEPHGDLIDRDALNESIKELRKTKPLYKLNEFWELEGTEIVNLIMGSPTVIEAEGGENHEQNI